MSMDEEKRDLPIPPKDLRRVPPPPPRIDGEKNVAQSEESADENSENVANEEKENEKAEIRVEGAKEKSEKKEAFWNRKPVLWSGILLGVALVAVVIFLVVAL